ncbi:MAG: mevalonate kinase [Coxiellaceae bacterium]|nr:mevalonate kinase [Coxiellaceae bacterium]
MSYSVSAPGSVMLMGEHAVLHGEPALVAAIDKRISVTLKRRSDEVITINSELGQYQITLSEMIENETFGFVVAAIKQWHNELPLGFELSIESNLPHSMGLGSSTAVVVAVTAALANWLRPELDFALVFQRALGAVRSIQGGCSGADVAASVYGGVLAYRALPFELQPLNWLPSWVLLYSGSKMKTADVIAHVQQQFVDKPEQLTAVYQQIGQCVRQAIEAVAQGDMQKLYQAIEKNQQAMQDLGVCNQTLTIMLNYLMAQPPIDAAKISGAGLGDCVIGFGELNADDCPYDIVPVGVSAKGVLVE